jgi:hypothetical protein
MESVERDLVKRKHFCRFQLTDFNGRSYAKLRYQPGIDIDEIEIALEQGPQSVSKCIRSVAAKEARCYLEPVRRVVSLFPSSGFVVGAHLQTVQIHQYVRTI